MSRLLRQAVLGRLLLKRRDAYPKRYLLVGLCDDL